MKNIKNYLIILLALLLILGSMSIFEFGKKKYEIVETKTFSCEGMEGFTFKYPVFRGWQDNPVVMTKEGGCIKYLTDRDKHADPDQPVYQLRVQKLYYGIYSAPDYLTQLNPNQVRFGRAERDQQSKRLWIAYDFWVGDAMVSVEILGLTHRNNFPAEAFFKTVIESFRVGEKITKQRAIDIAHKTIDNAKPGESRFVLLEDRILEKDFGWVFFYTTKKYLETNNPNDVLPGNGPLVVTSSGETHFLATSLPPERAIDEFEKQYRNPAQTITLKVGEKKQIKDVTIHLLSIAADSRCPEGVNCYWPGEAIVELQLKSNNGEVTAFLSTTGMPTMQKDTYNIDSKNYQNYAYLFGGYAISILIISPHKSVLPGREKREIAQSEYEVTFSIKQITK